MKLLKSLLIGFGLTTPGYLLGGVDIFIPGTAAFGWYLVSLAVAGFALFAFAFWEL